MKLSRLLLVCSLIVGLSTVSYAEKVKTEALKDKSKIEFVGKKSDGQHTGGFKDFAAVAMVDEENPSESTLSITIDTESLFSDDPKLTSHLKNPDFFDVRKYPKIEFTSSKVDHSEEGKVKITGKLKMLGKENDVEVPAEATVEEKDMTLVAKFKIDRTKWGMSYGVGKIDNDVEIVATLHFGKK